MVGRTIPAWAADHVGRFNTAALFAMLSSASVWAFWIPLHNKVGDLVFAVLYGVFSGAVIALTPALVAQIRYE